MDSVLTILFYLYVGLAFSAPLLVIPAIALCRSTSANWSNGLLMLIPILGIPLFFRALSRRIAASAEDGNMRAF